MLTLSSSACAMKYAMLSISLVGMFGLSSAASAAATPEELKQLGTTLTAWGAEKAGNKDGTIPAYTGEAIKVPANYDPKNPGARPDPFGDEKPLFSITAQNAAQYADKLSEGQKEMFKIYPSYRMDIYPSHRTARYPDLYVKNSLRNASECKATNGELLLSGCYGGTPFPIPKTGNQVMWNHVLQYQTSEALEGNAASYLSTSTGQPILQAGFNTVIQFPFFGSMRQTPASPTELYFLNRTDFVEPIRKNGEILVVIDAIDSTRRVYQYIPGQRRVKLAPDVAYDTPNPTAGGSMNMDDSILFFGAQDRWDFKLVGKKENFIIYNAFKSQEPLCPVTKLVSKSFMNPDCVRWELHRVWVLAATLKPGYRHNYSKRTFYFDEDMPGAGTADNYDRSGKIYRVSNVLPWPMYELQANPSAQGQHLTAYMTYDLQTGTYAVAGTSIGKGWRVNKPKTPIFFSPETLAGEGVR